MRKSKVDFYMIIVTNFSESSVTASRLENPIKQRSRTSSPVTTNGKISNL